MKRINLSRRNPFNVLFAIALIIGLSLSACAPAQPKTFVIGIVNPAAILSPVIDGFKAGLTGLEFVEGKNVTYVYDGVIESSKINASTQALIDKKVDLILALSTPAAQAAQTLTAGTNIPVLFVPVTDPVAAKLVPSLVKPGANLTGIATGGGENQRFEWLTRVVPTVKKIYLPYNPSDQSPVNALKGFQEVATKLGVELVLQTAKTADEVKAAIANIPDGVDAIFIGPDSLVGSLSADWIKAAIAHKLPLSGSSASHVKAGMLMSYSYDTTAVGKQAAGLAAQILKGAKPADLPVETSEFFLSINMQTAKAIGITVSDDILRQAGTVIR